MNWIYKEKVLDENDIPEQAIGFIYLIRQISTGKKYIGRKMLTAASSKKVNGKVKKCRKESDWKTYWSSSPQIKEWISTAGGTQDFTKEILGFCSSKSEMVYMEECLLYHTDALLKDNWINENIRAKIMKKWFIKNNNTLLSEVERVKTLLY